MAITPDFLDEIRARVRVSDVVGRRVKLTRRGREFVGLSPFNKEKSPSFTVNDQKAFYHCFSSGKHGDVFAFLQEVEGLSFPEAVERLAEEAGLEVPQNARVDKRVAEVQRTLLDVVEFAAQFFEQTLQSEGGRQARAYLEGRKLEPQTWKTFRLGYAPDNRMALTNFLKSKNVSLDLMEEAGLLTKNDAGDRYDKFRNRIMFPIEDARGRVIGFGGRALERDSNRPKYLNSPETPLFHKGRILYNHHRARAAAHNTQSVLVGEGYMDVIALAQAGFTHAVAPLGTALTQDQLGLMWRMAPEPVLCFDGDKAGLKAAYRAIDLALPLLKAGHSLRFALLPEGQDPDDIIAASGPKGFQDVLERARPLVEALWSREVQTHDVSTPEFRAGFEKRMSELLATIQEQRVRDHYRREFGNRWNDLFPRRTGARNGRASSKMTHHSPSNWDNRNARAGKGTWNGASGPPVPSGALLQSNLARSGGTSAFYENDSQKSAPDTALMRELVIVMTIVNHPELLESIEEDFVSLDIHSTDLDRVRREILEHAVSSPGVDRGALMTHLHKQGVGKIVERYLASNALRSFRIVAAEASADEALQGWKNAFAIHDRAKRLQAEHDEVIAELGEDPTEEKLQRWQALRAELDLLHNEASDDEPFS